MVFKGGKQVATKTGAGLEERIVSLDQRLGLNSRASAWSS